MIYKLNLTPTQLNHVIASMDIAERSLAESKNAILAQTAAINEAAQKEAAEAAQEEENLTDQE